MPAVGFTARLARDSRRAEKDTILFDKALGDVPPNAELLTSGTRTV